MMDTNWLIYVGFVIPLMWGALYFDDYLEDRQHERCVQALDLKEKPGAEIEDLVRACMGK